MKTVLYINNDKMQIVSAEVDKDQTKATVVNKISIDLDMDSVSNGVIVNKESILEKLILHRAILKDATVIINSSNIFVKKLDLPSLTGDQLISFIKSEFSLTDDGNVLYDANVYRTKTMSTAICCTIPRDLVKSYYDIFTEAHVVPKRIDIMQNAIVKYVESKEELKEKTFILNVIEDNKLASILFEEGKYVLTNRSGLLTDNLNSNLTEEIFSKLSSILMFNKSTKGNQEIEVSYYVGLNDEQLADLKTYTSRKVRDIEIKSFDEIINIPDLGSEFFYPFVGLLDRKEDINILNRYKKEILNIKIDKDKNLTRSIFLGGIVFLIVAALAAYYWVNIIIATTNATKMTTYVNQDSVQADLKTILQKNQRNVEIPATLTEILTAVNKSNKAGGLSADVLKKMDNALQPLKLDTLTYDSTARTIAIKCFGTDEYSASKFVTDMKNTGLFKSVDYTGYSYDTDTNSYSFSVVSTLK